MRLTVVIPWMAGSPDRAAALDFVRHRWAQLGVHVVVSEVERSEVWVKADAVMPAVQASRRGGIVMVSDADVWCAEALSAAQAVADGAAWAVPHLHVRRLTRDASRAVYDGARFEDLDAYSISENAYVGTLGGGLLATTREELLAIPFDSRFRGWGGEDCSIGYAFTATHGWPWRGTAPLWHLYHEPQLRADRHWGNTASEAVRKQYLAHHFDPAGMAVVLAQAREAATWRKSRSRSTPRASAKS